MVDWNYQFNIDADINSRVIFSKIFGVWREDTAKNYHEAFKEEAVDLIDKPWVKLVDLMNWKMGTPEVVDRIADHIKWCRQNNMEFQIFVVSDPMRFAQLKKMLKKGAAKDITFTFKSRTEALQYLREKGYEIES